MSDCDKPVNSLLLALRYPLHSFLTALRFLTVIPISLKQEDDGRFFQASVLWFPVVGALIGAVVVSFVALVSPFISLSLSALLGILLLGLLSGFLHLDGVADSGDGLLCSRPRERALSIMRDSRTGAMGVLFLVFLLLGKYAALTDLSIELLLPILFLMPIGGRTAILVSMAILPYARKEEGLGRLFYGKSRFFVAAAALFFFLVCTSAVSAPMIVFLLPLLLLSTALFSFWCYTKLGGATGDTLGAVCEFSELSIAIGAILYQGAL